MAHSCPALVEGMAEIKLGVLVRQCLDRRILDSQTLTQEVQAWQQQRNDEVIRCYGDLLQLTVV